MLFHDDIGQFIVDVNAAVDAPSCSPNARDTPPWLRNPHVASIVYRATRAAIGDVFTGDTYEAFVQRVARHAVSDVLSRGTPTALREALSGLAARGASMYPSPCDDALRSPDDYPLVCAAHAPVHATVLDAVLDVVKGPWRSHANDPEWCPVVHALESGCALTAQALLKSGWVACDAAMDDVQYREHAFALATELLTERSRTDPSKMLVAACEALATFANDRSADVSAALVALADVHDDPRRLITLPRPCFDVFDLVTPSVAPDVHASDALSAATSALCHRRARHTDVPDVPFDKDPAFRVLNAMAEGKGVRKALEALKTTSVRYRATVSYALPKAAVRTILQCAECPQARAVIRRATAVVRTSLECPHARAAIRKAAAEFWKDERVPNIAWFSDEVFQHAAHLAATDASNHAAPNHLVRAMRALNALEIAWNGAAIFCAGSYVARAHSPDCVGADGTLDFPDPSTCPFHGAAATAPPDVVTALLECVPLPHESLASPDGACPVRAALAYGRFDTAVELLKRGWAPSPRTCAHVRFPAALFVALAEVGMEMRCTRDGLDAMARLARSDLYGPTDTWEPIAVFADVLQLPKMQLLAARLPDCLVHPRPAGVAFDRYRAVGRALQARVAAMDRVPARAPRSAPAAPRVPVAVPVAVELARKNSPPKARGVPNDVSTRGGAPCDACGTPVDTQNAFFAVCDACGDRVLCVPSCVRAVRKRNGIALDVGTACFAPACSGSLASAHVMRHGERVGRRDPHTPKEPSAPLQPSCAPHTPRAPDEEPQPISRNRQRRMERAAHKRRELEAQKRAEEGIIVPYRRADPNRGWAPPGGAPPDDAILVHVQKSAPEPAHTAPTRSRTTPSWSSVRAVAVLDGVPFEIDPLTFVDFRVEEHTAPIIL